MSSQVLESPRTVARSPKTIKTYKIDGIYSESFNPLVNRFSKDSAKYVSSDYNKFQGAHLKMMLADKGYFMISHSQPSLIEEISRRSLWEKESTPILFRPLSDLRLRISLYLSVVLALATINIILIVSQSLPSEVAVPIVGGLAVAIFLSTAFVYLILKERKSRAG